MSCNIGVIVTDVWYSVLFTSSATSVICHFQDHNNNQSCCEAKSDHKPVSSTNALNRCLLAHRVSTSASNKLWFHRYNVFPPFFFQLSSVNLFDIRKNGVTYRGVLRAGCYDVFKEGIPLDVQYIALVATHFWVMRFQTARLKQTHK